VERERRVEGNTHEPHTRRTLSRGSVSPGLGRVGERARLKKKERFTALLHHVTVATLRWSYFALKRDAAPGVDRRTWRGYGQKLERCVLAQRRSPQGQPLHELAIKQHVRRMLQACRLIVLVTNVAKAKSMQESL
jgi:hypothetical protein